METINFCKRSMWNIRISTLFTFSVKLLQILKSSTKFQIAETASHIYTTSKNFPPAKCNVYYVMLYTFIKKRFVELLCLQLKAFEGCPLVNTCQFGCIIFIPARPCRLTFVSLLFLLKHALWPSLFSRWILWPSLCFPLLLLSS